MSIKTKLGLAAALAYVGVVVLANILSTRYGMVSVGFGLVASAGTYAAGAALGLRDAVREGLGRWGMVAVILIGSALSFWLASAVIATASLVAFTVSETLDALVYEPLRERNKLGAVVASNTVGAVADTYVFLSLAPFGPVTWTAMQGQLVGKILWATLVPVALIYAGKRAYEARA
jgi:queuosine precursor transporter